jgi:hypothetical protein
MSMRAVPARAKAALETGDRMSGKRKREGAPEMMSVTICTMGDDGTFPVEVEESCSINSLKAAISESRNIARRAIALFADGGDVELDGRLSVASCLAEADATELYMMLASCNDQEVLEDIYSSTDGPSWPDQGQWCSDSPIGEWSGVTVDAIGNVVTLSLRDRGLRGTLPSSIQRLTAATKIDLQGNLGLAGHLTSLEECMELKLLNFARTGLSSVGAQIGVHRPRGCSVRLPSEISLTFAAMDPKSALDFCGIGLKKKEVKPWIGELKAKVASLELHRGCRLTSDTSDIEDSTELDFSKLGFVGELPSFGACINLVVFSCRENGFEGLLPSFAACASLEVFDCSINGYSGPLPSFGHCKKLRVFRCLQNAFSGLIPTFGSCENLQSLVCWGNMFCGSLPSFEACKELKEVRCQGNNLSALPNFANCTQLQIFWCQANNFSISAIADFKQRMSVAVPGAALKTGS